MFASRLGRAPYLAAVKEFCAGLGYRLHVIAYIRPQSPLLNSLYTQNIKNWRPAISIDEFLDQEVANGRHHYGALFDGMLGDQEIDLTLRPFNRATLKKGLTTDICDVIGIDATDKDLTQPETANTSPGARTVAAFQRLRRQVASDFPDFDPERLAALTWPLLRVAGAQGWNDDKYGGITPSRHEELAQEFSATNEELARRAWSKAWDEVFSPADCQPPPLKVFDPETAEPAVLEEFNDFLEQALETIAEFAGTHQGQGSLI
jgi:hypothetical protein